MFSPYFWFCKHEAYAERVKGKDIQTAYGLTGEAIFISASVLNSFMDA